MTNEHFREVAFPTKFEKQLAIWVFILLCLMVIGMFLNFYITSQRLSALEAWQQQHSKEMEESRALVRVVLPQIVELLKDYPLHRHIGSQPQTIYPRRQVDPREDGGK